MFDEIVTLFCRVGSDKDGGWVRYAVHGVQMAELHGESAGTGIAGAIDRAQLLVPQGACGDYVPPEKWKALTAAECAGHFTLRTGDVFVRGAVESDDVPVSAYLARRGGWKITSVAQKGAGSALHHFAVGAGRLWSQTSGVL